MQAPLVPLSAVELRGLLHAREILGTLPSYTPDVAEAIAGVRSILKRGAMYADDWAEAVSGMFENEPPRDQDPAQINPRSVAERFGIANPREVMAEVDAIVEAKLGHKSGTEGGKPDNSGTQDV
jgi:hypothetical protein